jgi:hypothetical protein
MFSNDACNALRSSRCLQVNYNGFSRVVEVHAVGVSTAGNPVMRVWQIRGGSESGEPVGWKLMRLDEAVSVSLLNEKSNAPRPGYKQGDKGMVSIVCQL